VKATGRRIDTGEVVTIEVDRFLIDEPLQHDGLKLDPDRRQFWINGQPVRLTETQFRLIAVLMAKVGQCVTYEELCPAILGYPATGSARKTLSVHIYNLRKKKIPGIVNLRDRGYALNPQAQPADRKE